MTKEITKAFILQEIQDKFKMRELEPSKFVFDETVVPTYSIEEHLITNEAKQSTQSITAIGGVVFETVPDTERWFLHGYTIVPITGTYTFAGAYIIRKSHPTLFLYLDLVAGRSVAYAHLLSSPLTLDHGDMLGVNIDGYTVTGDLRSYIDYGKETIR